MQTVVTHSGSFDPDDVLAVAAVQLYLGVEQVKIVRSRDPKVIANADWAIDVGGKYDPSKRRFDHHQNGVPKRANGVPYSAFGLIWKEYGMQICDSVLIAQEIETKLVWPIDAADNHVRVCEPNELGVAAFEFFDVIDSFKPIRGTAETYDSEFVQATDFARRLLKRIIAQAKAQMAFLMYLDHEYKTTEDKRLLVFDEPVPRYLLAGYDGVQVIVAPSPAEDVGNWIATVIPKYAHDFENRAYFPEAWAGLSDGTLAEVSGIEDAIFCHKERYIFVAKTKAAAIAAAVQVLI